jgi:hypothetical protein
MRNSLLSFALIAGLFLPLGAIHAQDTAPVTATCKDGTPLPARSVPAPVGVTVVCSHGVRPRRQPALSPQLPRPRPQQASAPLPAPVAAPVKFGSIPTARCTAAPVIGGTARPNTAVICPRRRRRRRVSDRITERLAPRKAFIEDSRYTTLPKSCSSRAGRLKAALSRARSNNPRPPWA